ncbi:EAL domain-containing protein [Arsukibacterium sp.]|uniref:EAL domain-containing protein n=1 Tax=Arsukibacterium sp. TaxID=1977258 RepID=UPI002FDA7BCE
MKFAAVLACALLGLSVLSFPAMPVSANTPVLMPLTPDSGLSQGSVNDLIIDSQGFLWLATAGGINRFDSREVVQLKSRQHSLQEQSFSRILEDSQQRIWALSTLAGLYLFHPEDGVFDIIIKLPENTEQHRHEYFLDMVEVDINNLLLLTNHTLYQLELTTGNLQILYSIDSSQQDDVFFRTLLYSDGAVFLGGSHGLHHLELKSKTSQFLQHLPFANTNADQLHVKLLRIDDRYLWVGTVEGLYRIPLPQIQHYLAEGTAYQADIFLPERNIWALHWQDKQLLLATDQGLLKMHREQQSVAETLLRFSDSKLDLYNNNILDIVQDEHGGFWLASRDDGAFYWHPSSRAFSQYSATSKVSAISSDKVYDIIHSGQRLWYGSDNGLHAIDIQSGEAQSFFISDDPKATWHQGTVIQLFAENPQKLWFVSATGLNYFDKQQGVLVDLPLKNKEDATLLGEGAFYFYRHNDGSFIYLYRQQVYQYQPATGEIKPLKAFSRQLKISDFHGILGLAPDQDDSLLVAVSDQIWRYHIKLEQLSLIYQVPDFLPHLHRNASNMLLDEHDVLWVGMQGIGLLGFDAKTMQLIHHFSAKNILTSNGVYALQQDTLGFIWFSSHQGLSRLNPTNLSIEHFNKADDLAVHEFNDGMSTKMADGKLAFGSMRGIVLVDPQLLPKTLPEPRVVITGVNVLAGDFLPRVGVLNNQQLKLSHRDLGIQLRFSPLNYYQAHKIRYRFWLEGSNAVSYPIQSHSEVTFPQLRPGRYTFNVVAIAPNTNKESPVARLQLTIAPPPWLSYWAISLYLLIAALFIIVLWRYRRNQQQLLQTANQEVRASEQRLKQALHSVDSGAFEWQASSNMLISSRPSTMLGYSEMMDGMTLPQHLSLIHPEDKNKYSQQWQRFLQQPEHDFAVTYRLKHQKGHWLWFRDQGRATQLHADGSVAAAVGTYSNITETRASMEQAKLFGEAFQQTRDWVVILDAQQRVIAANQSFTTAFGKIEDYLDNPRTHHLGISLVRRRFYTRLLRGLKLGEHWQGEEQVITPDGRERPTLINISAIGEQQVAFYVLVFTDITAQKLAEEELRYLANYDALTGLPNRALLMDRILHGIEQARRDKRPLALCFIDLDKFKHINDSLGHDVGDLLLKEVARRLSLTLRESDTVARLGGDEFVVLLEGYKANHNLSHVARKMLTSVSEPMQLGPHTVGVSPSIGIAIYPDDASNATELLKHADVAMYHAKEAGRNNFQFFISEMNEKAHLQLARETQLRQALQQQEFVNFYQPIINSQNQSIVGVEVLLRWQSRDGMIPPSEFIPLAEELRLIVKMTQSLLKLALKDVAQWRAAGHQLYLSVNLSTQHLEQAELAEHTAALLKAYQLPASCLRFEITESALMRDHQSAIDTMLALNKLGIELALDDFGTGYSSLKYLKELPIDAIKIDRSFVKDIGIDHNDETIIDAMLSMANSLGMYCIAEGVETEQQLAFFTRRQCYFIQGFLFAKPMPAEALLTLLNSNQFNQPAAQ